MCRCVKIEGAKQVFKTHRCCYALKTAVTGVCSVFQVIKHKFLLLKKIF